jgi:hypothetical protein
MFKKLLTAITLSIALLAGFSVPAMAGTDLVVSCDGQDSCTVSPVATPLFDETTTNNALIAPGDTRSQVLSVTNDHLVDTCNVQMEIIDQSDSGQPVNLATRIFTVIDDGVGETFNGTLQQLFDTGSLDFGTVLPDSTHVFTWTATFDPDAGNDYQGVSTVFDFEIDFSCVSPPTPPPSFTSSSTTTSGGGTSPASPPVCSDAAPVGAPAGLTATASGPNQVTLNWAAVPDPVTHYALVFTRGDGAAYGSNNIGKTTSYVINNLDPNASYTFEIFAVNGCAPGPRSSATTTSIGGGPVTGGPIGGDDQVLGVDDDTQQEVLGESAQGAVRGLETSCALWKFYLPWILLIVQAVVILASEFYFKAKPGLTKHYVTIGMTLVSIILFYLLRACDCYQAYNWLKWLCTWYWLPAILLSLFLRGFSYAFLEEVDEPKSRRR